MKNLTNRSQAIGMVIVLVVFCAYFTILPFLALSEFNGVFGFWRDIVSVMSEQYSEGPTTFFYLYTSSFILLVISTISAVTLVVCRGCMLKVCTFLLVIFIIINIFIAFTLSDIPVLAIGVLLPAYCVYLALREKKGLIGADNH